MIPSHWVIVTITFNFEARIFIITYFTAMDFSIAVHGGAGIILRKDLSKEQEALYRNGLQNALQVGYDILKDGGSALDAAEAAMMSIEDDPVFNAGRGSVFTHEGKHEMDACIMDGSSLLAGAVTCVSNVKNPIRLARSVMENSEHVFLSGKGAEEFAHKMNLEFQPDEYFHTEYRYRQLMAIRESNQVILDHMNVTGDEKKFGTGGAVCRDKYGNLAAATSTGGMTNKRFNRIGDTPIVGAGTYANNNTCAVSCTGHGEYFIRAVVAYDVSCLMEYKGLSLEEAARIVVNEKLVKMSGEGGLVAVDRFGNVTMPFNSDGMYRGYMRSDGTSYIGIFKDELL